MPPNIINSGTPLSGDVGGELWTDKCDASANLQNQTAIAPLAISLSGIEGNGSFNRQVQVTAPGLIDKIAFTGNFRGKYADQITLNLKHEKYGTLPLLTGHSLQLDSPPTGAYPDTSLADLTMMLGQAIPTGYRFLKYLGSPQHFEFQIPEGVVPQNNYYYSYYNGTGTITIKAVGPQPSPYTISVPPHRLPNSPNYGSGDQHVTIGFAQDGYAYTPTSESTNPSIVSTQTFQQISGPGFNYGSWLDFSAASYTSWGEKLFSTYNAHFWVEVATSTSTSTVGTSIVTTVTHTLQFWRYPNRNWLVQPPAIVTWQGEIPPLAVYRFYPPDYDEFSTLTQRIEAILAEARDWYNNPAAGLYTLEVALAPNGYLGSTTPNPVNPSVTPAIIGVDAPTLTITFKQNQPYQQAALNSSTDGQGNTIVTAAGNLVAVPDDRAMVAILCGISGSQQMGILCGYAVQQVDLTKPIYNVSYFILTTCNVNNVSYSRPKQSIEFLGQDWTGFSTKGNQGRAFVIGARGYKNYPVEGQIGMKVKISGNRLTFQLLGDYPELVYEDPTVLNVDNFSRFALNA